jgi:hypothetical protein
MLKGLQVTGLKVGRWRGLGLPLRENKVAKKMKPVHSGEILREEFMIPWD